MYLSDSYLFTIDANIIDIGSDEKGQYLVLDKTIFYPQGGGQKADKGKISNDFADIEVNDVRQLDDEIRHYCSPFNNGTFTLNSKVKCVLNEELRLLNMKYHTAGHLLGNVVDEMPINIKSRKCHAFPGESYVEFMGAELPNRDLLVDKLKHAILAQLPIKSFEIGRQQFEELYYKLPYDVPLNKNFRVVQIGNYSPIPCGGTHLSSTTEIGEIEIRKIKSKDDVVKISYGLK